MSVRRLFEIFEPHSYSLFLDLSKSRQRIFDGRVKILGTPQKSDSISLHSKYLNISNIYFNGENLKFKELEDDEIEIFSGNNPFTIGQEIEIVLEFSGNITDGMHGLYPCYYKEKGVAKELLATQFESHHAREVFPCVDEPEAKAYFELELKTSNDVEVLSNTAIVSVEKYEGNILSKFEKTPKMSTYLLAFVVGDLQKKTALTKAGVEVSVWSTKAQDLSLLDFPLETAVKVLEFYEEYFDEKFMLKKCQHVALPDFSSGAMENWGLITYRESALLAGNKSAISAKKYVALVIAHETAHQWFGNLVTMKWWDDLWLNESFANMMEYFAVDAIFPEWNIWEEFAVNEAVVSLRRDAIDGVQSVHVPVNHPDEIGTIFDGAIVYAKGARLMNMLRKFVGDNAFKKGLRQYFKKYKYQNTVGANLWECLSQASGKDIASFMDSWISRSGYPVVYAKLEGDNLSLSQKQFFIGEGKDTNKIWPIILGANHKSLPEIMDSKELSIKFDSDFLKLNEGNIAHFISNYSLDLFEKLLSKIESLDSISRLQILQERSLLARSGEVKSSELLIALSKLKNEESLNVWHMMNILISELKIFIDEGSKTEDRMKRFVGRLANKQFDKLGFIRRRNETESETEMRSVILGHLIYADNKKAIDEAISIFDNTENIEEIDAEIRALVLLAKIRQDESPVLVSDLLNKYIESSNVDFRDDLMIALTSTKNIKTVELLLEKMKDPKTIRPQDLLSWYIHILRNHNSRELAWRWLRDEWKFIEDIFGDDKSYNDFPRYVGSILRTDKQLVEFMEFFSPMKNEPALIRAIEMGEREIRSRIELLARDKADFEIVLADIVD